MIPLRDSIRSHSFPIVTKALILANLVAFLWELSLGPQLAQAFLQYAIIPARYTHPAEAAEVFGAFAHPGAAVLPFFSSMFLHGGWMHLLGNMWTLWIFGDNVEDRLGKARYLAFYLGSGLAAGLVHVVTNPHSGVPTIGASGAVAGVMGAYFRFFPGARIEAVIPPFFLGPIFVLPAVVFLGWWFLLQFFNGAFSLMSAGEQFGGIAWWAHVGGFLFGLVVCLFARRARRTPPRFIEI
ncbi:MAG: rhomboid family intramembrane serine protease [Verrucomicrobiae bacterium]|nr:rhomboid family intramembrane serine protease [Verrucomicrobiae bacterium]